MRKDPLLLTPGPLSTTESVKKVMNKDICTWDRDYKKEVEFVREKILKIGEINPDIYTTVLMQGSGSFAVEATLNTATFRNSNVLILKNGEYGNRIEKMLEMLGINNEVIEFPFREPIDPSIVDRYLEKNTSITHVVIVHCETTTGILNDISSLGKVIKNHEKIFIVDAMSSFGGIPINFEEGYYDFLISSSNKCIQGVPGFGFVICKKGVLKKCKGNSTSHALDLYDQWATFEKDSGKWRFTSPTQSVLAFKQALIELEEEGGVEKRYLRYVKNNQYLNHRMKELGFKTMIKEEVQSPIITTFLYEKRFTFKDLYHYLKAKNFIIYPGKLTDEESFRIGTIGDVYPKDLKELCNHIENFIKEGERDGK